MQKDFTQQNINVAIAHNLILEERKNMKITGVIKVHSCDENIAVMDTPLGRLHIEGKNLAISELSLQTGEVRVNGEVDGIGYTQTKETAGGLIKRFLR